MSHDPLMTASGKIADVFAHRFVLQTAQGRVLADIGPKGAEQIQLHVGDQVTISGEKKPSELKVARFVKDGGTPVEITHKKLHEGPDHHPPADLGPVLKTAKSNGFSVVGEPRRKPKHFEVLGKSKKVPSDIRWPRWMRVS